MLFENENPYLDMLLNIGYDSNLNMDSDSDYMRGFLKGNMFDGLYEPYKNMTYIKPRITDKRSEDLFNIMMYSFVINDYNLYLDLHPDDASVYEKFKNATIKLHNLKENYIKTYGPLEVCDSPYNNYKWLSSPWPWDNDGGKYV